MGFSHLSTFVDENWITLFFIRFYLFFPIGILFIFAYKIYIVSDEILYYSALFLHQKKVPKLINHNREMFQNLYNLLHLLCLSLPSLFIQVTWKKFQFCF